MRRFHLVTCAALFSASVTALFLMLSSAAVRADLPPEAREDIKQGLAAVEKKDYAKAAQFFESARISGGPAIYREMGLAESEIPGRELRAICWLSAYLAAYPTAADAAGLKAKIDEMDAKSREKTLRLLQSFQTAVLKMPDREARESMLEDLAQVLVQSGDVATAKKMVALIPEGQKKYDVLCTFACDILQVMPDQVRAGDMADARNSLAEMQKAVGLIPDGSTKSEAQYHVAIAWITIAGGQLMAGDIKGAQESLATERDMDSSVEGGMKSDVWRRIAGMQVAMAKAQIKAGDAAGARKSIAAALETADLLNGPQWPWKLNALEDVAGAQIKAGDMKGARETLASALPVARDAHALRAIAQAQVRAGDLDGAKKTAGLIDDPKEKAATLAEITGPPKKTGAAPIAQLPAPPLPSDLSTLSGGVGYGEWTGMVEGILNNPCMTAFPDYSDYKAITDEIQRDPPEGPQLPTDGQQAQNVVRPLDDAEALRAVANRVVWAQKEVDMLLRVQFKK